MENVLLKATGRFSTSITVSGDLVWQDWAEGDERAVTEQVAELLLREVPGCLVVVKPKAEKKSPPKVETKAGPTEDSKTRAVKDAPKRTRKTKKAEK